MTTGRKQAELNVTPLIDVLLVLLIIFMVSVPTRSVGECQKIASVIDTARGIGISQVALLKASTPLLQ
jgi:biopolymer transport protein ExbD